MCMMNGQSVCVSVAVGYELLVEHTSQKPNLWLAVLPNESTLCGKQLPPCGPSFLRLVPSEHSHTSVGKFRFIHMLRSSYTSRKQTYLFHNMVKKFTARTWRQSLDQSFQWGNAFYLEGDQHEERMEDGLGSCPAGWLRLQWRWLDLRKQKSSGRQPALNAAKSVRLQKIPASCLINLCLVLVWKKKIWSLLVTWKLSFYPEGRL